MPNVRDTFVSTCISSSKSPNKRSNGRLAIRVPMLSLHHLTTVFSDSLAIGHRKVWDNLQRKSTFTLRELLA